MPRIELITRKEQLAPEHHAVFDAAIAARGTVGGPTTVVLHSPKLGLIYAQGSSFYLFGGTLLTMAESELTVLAVARERDCQFVWASHVAAARSAGVSDGAIAAARDRGALAGLPVHEGDVIDYVRQLCHTNRVERGLFDRLLAGHSTQWLVELTGFVGRYNMVGGILNAFEVLPAEDAEQLPVPSPVARPPKPSPAPPAASPRVPLIVGREQVAPAHHAIFDTVTASRGVGRGPHSILLYSPVLSLRTAELGTFMRTDAALTDAQRELGVLGVARERDCRFIWADHAEAALTAGVSAAAVAAVRDRSPLAGLSAEERGLIDYVRQLHLTNRIAQPLFDELRDRYGIPWLVEFTVLVGHYQTVACTLNAFEVAPSSAAALLPL